jgi:hypothetical protein
MNTSGLQIRNLSILSTEEIIHYIEAGIVENIPGEVVLKILSKMEELKEELNESENSYSKGYDAAVDEMIGMLNNM